MSYVATDGEEIATGETNPDTTLATQSLVADIEDFSGWGFPYSDELAGMDIGCLELMHEGLWQSVDVGDSGSIGGRIGLMNAVLKGLMAAGAQPEEFYFPAYSGLMRAMMNGSIAESGFWEEIVARAEEGDPELDTTAALNLYADGADDDLAEMRAVLAGATADSTANALIRALTTTTGGDAMFPPDNPANRHEITIAASA